MNILSSTPRASPFSDKEGIYLNYASKWQKVTLKKGEKVDEMWISGGGNGVVAMVEGRFRGTSYRRREILILIKMLLEGAPLP